VVKASVFYSVVSLLNSKGTFRVWNLFCRRLRHSKSILLNPAKGKARDRAILTYTISFRYRDSITVLPAVSSVPFPHSPLVLYLLPKQWNWLIVNNCKEIDFNIKT
jgi:hypothetical protein